MTDGAPDRSSIEALPPRRRAALERAIARVDDREKRALAREAERHEKANRRAAELLPVIARVELDAERVRHETAEEAIRACRAGDRRRIWQRTLAALGRLAAAADQREIARAEKKARQAAKKLTAALRPPKRVRDVAELEAHRARVVEAVKAGGPAIRAIQNALRRADDRIHQWMSTRGRSPLRLQASAVAALRTAFQHRDAEGEERERHEIARRGWILSPDGIWFLFIPPGAAVRAPDQAGTPDQIGASDPGWVADIRREAERRWSALADIVAMVRGPQGARVVDFVAALVVGDGEGGWVAKGAMPAVKAGPRPRPTYWPRVGAELAGGVSVKIGLGSWDCAFVGAVTMAGSCGRRGLWSGVVVHPGQRPTPVPLEWRGQLKAPAMQALRELNMNRRTRPSLYPSPIAAFCPSGQLWAVVMPMVSEGSPFTDEGEIRHAASVQVIEPPEPRTPKAPKAPRTPKAPRAPRTPKAPKAPASGAAAAKAPALSGASALADDAQRAELARMFDAATNARDGAARETAFAAGLALAPRALARWGWADHAATLPPVPEAPAVVAALARLARGGDVARTEAETDAELRELGPPGIARFLERQGLLADDGGRLRLAGLVSRNIERRPGDLTAEVAKRLGPARSRWRDGIIKLATNLLGKARRHARGERISEARKASSQARKASARKTKPPPADQPKFAPYEARLPLWVELHRIHGVPAAVLPDGRKMLVAGTPWLPWSDEQIERRALPLALVQRRGGRWVLTGKGRGFVESGPTGFKDLVALVDFAEERAHAKASRSSSSSSTPRDTTRGRETYKAAAQRLLGELAAAGWSTAPNLKRPHATSPDRTVQVWFMPQAVHASRISGAGRSSNARTLDVDRRGLSVADLIARLGAVS